MEPSYVIPDKRGDPEITLAEQRAYMNRVRNELT